MNRSALLTLLAVVCFIVVFVITVFDIDASVRLTLGFLYGGFALFAAGHLPER